jgi:serine/threonine protein kinase
MEFNITSKWESGSPQAVLPESGHKIEMSKNAETEGSRSLANLLTYAPGDVDELLPVFGNILKRLDTIYADGSEHGPLTPAAILIHADRAADLPAPTFAQEGATIVFGSAKYSAPEAFRATDTKAPDSALDSYVLGFIFYEILLGSRLFGIEFAGVDDDSPSAWWTWHANESAIARPLVEVLQGFPEWISMLIEGMLRKTPSERIDLKEAVATLSGAIEKTIVSKSRVDLTPPHPVAPPSAPADRNDDKAGCANSGIGGALLSEGVGIA